MSNTITFAVPSDVQLRSAPIPADWLIEGEPQAASLRLSASADGTSSTMVWTCTPGKFNWYYTVDETVYLLEGEVFVTNEQNEVRRLGPGDLAFFPAGSHSVWHVTKEVRKIAFLRHSIPRVAGYALRGLKKFMDMIGGKADDALEPSAVPGVAEPATQAKAA